MASLFGLLEHVFGSGLDAKGRVARYLKRLQR
jgi:hypothetical protein